MKVAFFLLHYPVFSETFVSKEILNLQKLGVDGQIYCEKKITTPPFHPHINQIHFPLHQITQKILGADFFPIIYSHFYYLFHRPFAYLKSLNILSSFFNYNHLRVFIKAPLLARSLSQNNIDLIYVHEIDSPCLFGLICSQLCQIPIGIIIHTQYLFAQNKFLIQKIKRSNFIIFQSLYSLKQSKKITKLPKKYFSKCHVLSTPGVDTKFFHPPDHKVYPQQIRLISIGRLEEAKGYPLLLKAIRNLKSVFPDIQLTIVGNGSQKTQLQNYISKNNLQNNILLAGAIGHNSKLIKLLHHHQYFILPSIVDSQNNHDVHPNVVKEAMSSGLIIITTRLGGITEIIHNSQNGFLINSVTVPSLCKAIKKVYSLPKSQKIKISNSARQTIFKHHQQTYLCSQLKQIFSDQIDEK
jgi:glycosyltransferase involved in cell wall biosynthesis